MADENEKVQYFPGKFVKCGSSKWTFDNTNNFKPYDEANGSMVGGWMYTVNLLDESRRGDFEPEFIELGPVTAEDIERVKKEEPKLKVDHPPAIKDLSREQFAVALQCYDDLISVMVYPELELVLKSLNKQLNHLQPTPKLSWESGRLAINGVKTKLRACEAYEAVRSLCKLGTHQRASEAVAALLVEKIKELF
jgi:hypothetical protein